MCLIFFFKSRLARALLFSSVFDVHRDKETKERKTKRRTGTFRVRHRRTDETRSQMRIVFRSDGCRGNAVISKRLQRTENSVDFTAYSLLGFTRVSECGVRRSSAGKRNVRLKGSRVRDESFVLCVDNFAVRYSR